MRNKIADIILGIIFVTAGVLIAGNLLWGWNFTLFFNGWWTLFIIVPCFISFIKNGFNFGGLFGVGIGVIFFLACNDMFGIKWENFWQILVPFVLVMIGLSIIFRGSINARHFQEQKSVTVDGEIPNYTAVFCGNGCKVQGERFNGATASAVFGGIELNLRDAIIDKDVIINCSVIFGGADIFLPPNVKAKVSTTPIFGGADNTFTGSTAEDAPTVFINATAIFGGVDIK